MDSVNLIKLIIHRWKSHFFVLFYNRFQRARVLQRSAPWSPPLSFMSLKFELAFNLAVIWMIVFVALGKGINKNTRHTCYKTDDQIDPS